jgi:hypothetical protein
VFIGTVPSLGAGELFANVAVLASLNPASQVLRAARSTVPTSVSSGKGANSKNRIDDDLAAEYGDDTRAPKSQEARGDAQRAKEGNTPKAGEPLDTGKRRE